MTTAYLSPHPRQRTPALCALLVALALLGVSISPGAQSFNSGSDGSDGALTIAANSGIVVFDPLDTTQWGKVLDPDGDGVYNFTTITINSGSTLRLGGDKVNKPVYWLASGSVVISGVLDLSGAGGTFGTDPLLRRQVAVPGSGGFAGGAGGRTNSAPPNPPATAGEGPGGGSGGVTSGSGSCTSTNICGKGATFTGNRYAIPLSGGSGGEGARYANGNFYGGGAGGGAILIASSVSITLGGAINANGGAGAGGVAGSGGGGTIRLVAPTLSGAGNLYVLGDTSPENTASDAEAGWVRLEGFVISSSFVFNAGITFLTKGSPVDPNSLKPTSSIRVTAIDGIPVPANPTGSFNVPDVTINKNVPVNVDIQANGVPPGTVVTLVVYPQSPADLTTINLPTAQVTLAGTLQSSTGTATFTFPYGFSRGYLRTSWTQ